MMNGIQMIKVIGLAGNLDSGSTYKFAILTKVLFWRGKNAWFMPSFGKILAFKVFKIISDAQERNKSTKISINPSQVYHLKLLKYEKLIWIHLFCSSFGYLRKSHSKQKHWQKPNG